ncbi:MAG: hypothetical protein M3Q14_04085 [bacterium]|nr:hypothetical protein [bacterium]
MRTRPRVSPTFRGTSDRAEYNQVVPALPQAPRTPSETLSKNTRSIGKYLNKFINKKFLRSQAILIGGIIITLLIGLVVLQKSITSNLEIKYAAQRAKAADIQSLLANLPDISSLQPGQSAEGAFIVGRYQAASQTLENTSLDKPNIIDRLLSPGNANRLNYDFSETRKAADTSRTHLTSITEQLNVIKKFIEYNPRQDFIEFGKNKTNDDERLGVTKQGFLTTQIQLNSTAANTPETASSKQMLNNQLQSAINAAEAFKTHRNVNTFAIATSDSQSAIINSLQTQLKTSQDSYQTAYHALD